MRRWKQLSGELGAMGVGFVAISPDKVWEAAAFRTLWGWRADQILSDGDLAVTDAYNLRSHKTFAIGPGRSIVRYLAVPTTILVDADGIVRWVDRATDYRVRSEPDRVLPAIRAALAEVRAAG